MQRLRVLDRGPERLDRLAGERPAGEVDDRHRDPERQLRRDVARGRDRRLRVQGVEDRLDQEQVDPALAQRCDLLRVRRDDLVEGDRAEGRVVDLRRERQGHVERAERAGDEAAAGLVRRLPGETRAGDVHVADGVLEPVVGLPDPGRGEGVRRRDVGAGGEVLPVDVEHDVGTRQVEQVRIAGDVARMVGEPLAPVVGVLEPGQLEHRPPGAVEHEDPLAKKRLPVCRAYRSRVHSRA